MRGSSFDREEARRAWRQVARIRGHGGAPQDNEPGPLTARRVMVGIVIAVAAVLAVAKLTEGDSEPAPKLAVAPETKAKAKATTSATAAHHPPSPTLQPIAKAEPAATPVVSAPNPTFKPSTSPPPSSPPTLPPPNPTFKPSTPQAATAAASTLTRPRTEVAIERLPSSRTIPVGTDKTTAKTYAKIPLASRDRAPVGHIAPSGLHVDRIALGTGYDANRCTGTSTRFVVDTVEEINVCVRAVHLRQGERLTVRWEREGLVMRITRLYIPPRHAYRTRAGLRLRPGYAGRWNVRVMSGDGELELASAPFELS